MLEYASLGSLDNYLRCNGDSLSNNDLLMMTIDICNGMAYLQSLGIIHRDLAAREYSLVIVTEISQEMYYWGTA